MNYAEVARIWDLYEKGKHHHNEKNMYSKADRCHKMYEGDQWDGIGAGVDKNSLPQLNFITPTVKYKVGAIAMNGMSITYSPMDGGDAEVCGLLNNYAAKMWEAQKMDTVLWNMAQEACIVGESYLYFHSKNLDNQLIDNTAIYLGDEQQPDLQKQPYIIVFERRLVRDVLEEAKRNKVSKEMLGLIMADESKETLVGDRVEVKGEHGKCSCLVYITKREGEIHFAKLTREVMYQPLTRIPGMKRYPFVNLIWNREHNSARGVGEVWPLIANQVEVNKMAYRRLQNMKVAAFPKMVYVEDKVLNPENLQLVGEPIKLKGISAQRVHDYISYLQPSGMSADAANLQNEMIDRTRDLANAGNAAMGNIDPEQASGAAIAAVRDAQAIPLNEQESALKQTVEDIAKVWLDMMLTYHNNGMTLQDGSAITAEEVRKMQLQIKIDVSPRDPFSKYAQEQTLAALYQSGAITLEEYVDALDDSSNTPKGKLKEILRKRAETEEQRLAEEELVNAVLQMRNEGGAAPGAGGWPAGAGAEMPDMQ